MDDSELRRTAAKPLLEQDGTAFPRIVAVMRRLLGEGGCPWDREQTFHTMRPFVIEEAHEVVDAIDRNSPDELREELGDLLMQIVFLAELAKKEGWFGPDDVVDAISDKMVHRHPHVFEDVLVESSAEVLNRWEAGKAKERAATGKGGGALSGVPVHMPALLRAVRIGEKAGRVGFDWHDCAGPRAKISEELDELDAAVRDAESGGDPERVEEELGDLLFAIASWARKRSIDPEASLRRALDRFTSRFEAVEAMAREEGRGVAEMSTDELDRAWNRVKSRTRG